MPYLLPQQLKDSRLREAEEAIAQIVSTYRLRITKTIRRGPRYYVAEVMRNKRKALFKICLYRKDVDGLTNEKFGREVLFLDYLQTSRRRLVRRTAPGVFALGTDPRAWYIREFITGKTQNISGGSIRFRPSFFSSANLRWLTRFFTELQDIRSSELPSGFRRLLHAPDFASQLLVFMQPHWSRIEKILGIPGARKSIRVYFLRNQHLYNSAPRCLVHQEPYADHLIKQGKTWRLIDWENIGWGNPVHDAMVIWMRASQHPSWQATFKKGMQRRLRPPTFDALWEMEMAIQAVFNVISWKFVSKKADMRHLFHFSKHIVREIIRNERSR